MPWSPPSRELSSQEVILFCETLESIRDAGVPLDFGLLHSVPQLPPRLGQTITRLAERVSRGTSLAQALSDEQETIPPVFQAVLAAGLHQQQTGQLLRDIATTSQHLDTLRKTLRRGFVYPTILVLITLLFLMLVGPRLWTPLLNLYDSLQVTPPPVTAVLTFLNSSSGTRILTLLTGLTGASLLYILYAAISDSGLAWDRIARIPGAGKVLKNIRTARLAQTLSLLVDYQIPLPEALKIVAHGTGPSRYEQDLRQLALNLEAGQPLEQVAPRATSLPPLMRWLMTVGQQDSRLPQTLRETADYYRLRAFAQADWLARLVPVLAIVFIGGGVTLVYGLMLFGPMAELLHALEVP